MTSDAGNNEGTQPESDEPLPLPDDEDFGVELEKGPPQTIPTLVVRDGQLIIKKPPRQAKGKRKGDAGGNQ